MSGIDFADGRRGHRCCPQMTTVLASGSSTKRGLTAKVTCITGSAEGCKGTLQAKTNPGYANLLGVYSVAKGSFAAALGQTVWCR